MLGSRSLRLLDSSVSLSLSLSLCVCVCVCACDWVCVCVPILLCLSIVCSCDPAHVTPSNHFSQAAFKVGLGRETAYLTSVRDLCEELCCPAPYIPLRSELSADGGGGGDGDGGDVDNSGARKGLLRQVSYIIFIYHSMI